jgi:hypothetical protein
MGACSSRRTNKSKYKSKYIENNIIAARPADRQQLRNNCQKPRTPAMPRHTSPSPCTCTATPTFAVPLSRKHGIIRHFIINKDRAGGPPGRRDANCRTNCDSSQPIDQRYHQYSLVSPITQTGRMSRRPNPPGAKERANESLKGRANRTPRGRVCAIGKALIDRCPSTTWAGALPLRKVRRSWAFLIREILFISRVDFTNPRTDGVYFANIVRVTGGDRFFTREPMALN